MKEQALDLDPQEIHHISFSGNLDQAGDKTKQIIDQAGDIFFHS